jgi:trafficking protein particle complex subunit 4
LPILQFLTLLSIRFPIPTSCPPSCTHLPLPTSRNPANRIVRVVYALLIINKAGGLVFNRTFHSGLQNVGANDLLILAGTFHGVHAISRGLSPVPPNNAIAAGTAGGSSSNRASTQGTAGTGLHPSPLVNKSTGIEVLESAHFRLQCFETVTGTKFLLFTEPQQPNVDTLIHRIYELYADYVMKNPFYTVEMPIRCEKFDRGLDNFVKARV